MESAFRGPLPDGLKVIETLRLEPRGAGLIPLHLARLTRSCAALGIAVDPGAVRARIERVRTADVRRARLTVDVAGRVEVETTARDPRPGPWRLGWAGARILAGDPWRRVKTTERGIYDRARAALPAALDELLFLNDRDRVAEGTITNVFVATERGLATPPVSDGALPGVLRRTLLDSGRAHEAELWPADLEGAEIFVGNALRGLIPALLEPRRT